ncbi:hypothetical protein N9B60_05840, partial [Mariniblastus sp.]|nr:hypothetical protein [Mariniblastus sp.]
HPFFVSRNLGLTYGTNAKARGVVVRILGWVTKSSTSSQLSGTVGGQIELTKWSPSLCIGSCVWARHGR